LDGTESALLAQQSEFIEGGRALGFDAEAFGQEQQSALEGHSGQLFAPHLVVEQNPDEVPEDRLAPQLGHNAVGVDLEVCGRQRRHRVELRHVIAHGLQDVLPLDQRGRDVLLGRPPLLLRHETRQANR